ncbi:SAV_2336 N-terminal domain-related protein [Dapis sp. BLCC M229]|uniref:SAV_2336 N-terminal domain-related protein n=1 Tax=Dapis sp. BLCC M229 TaxID=3400188 RepID=UPI003CF1B56F
MIDELITALSQEVGMSGEEIADTIWLALQIQESPSGSVSSDFSLVKEDIGAMENKTTAPKLQPQTPDSNETPKNQDSEAQKAKIYPQSQQQTESLDLSFKTPNAPSLRQPLILARALKPLMRRIPAGTNFVLDETATIEGIANTRLWLPVLRPTLEPWLDLELVVDESISMQIWRQTIRDLEKLLKNYGIFRDVRAWGMTAKDGEKVEIRRGMGAAAKNKFPRSSKELIDGSSRRLVLVVSDCVSSYWRDGKVTKALEIWGNSVPTAIIQMLPKWLWKRTALGRASEVRLRALTPGVSNQNLIAQEVSLWEELEEKKGIKVPIFTLEEDKTETWAQMLSGKSSVSTLGFLFKLDAPVKENSLFNLDYSQLSAEDRVQAFRVTASPMARKLAGLLAAAPVISLPVVRLIRGALLRESLQINVAEVFLGGLLKPLSEIKVETNPDDILYGFVDGVRELFIDSMPSDRVLNVVDKVSEYMAERVGLSLEDFAAVLRREKEVEDSGVVEEVGYFATVTAQVLRRLGGEYGKVADKIEVKNQEPLQKLVRAVDQKAFEIEFANLLSPNNSDGSFLLTFIRRSLKQFNLDRAYTEDDILSEVYLRGVKTLQEGKTIRNFLPWIRAVVYNYIRELSREKLKSVQLESYHLQPEYKKAVKQNLYNLYKYVKFNPELASASIALAFKKLTPDEKKLLQYKVIEDLSWEKIQSLEEYQDFTLSDLRKWHERILKKLRLLYYSVENASEDIVSN